MITQTETGQAEETTRVMQVWEAEADTDLLVLREVLKLAEADSEVAADVLSALYGQRDHDEALAAILTHAEEAPLRPLAGVRVASRS
jgi:hypothetical protein